MPLMLNRSSFFSTTFVRASLLLALLCLPIKSISDDAVKASTPWIASQVIQPEELAHSLAGKSAALPTIVYVGPHTLFAGGHIPGAVFHGAAANQQDLAELKKWAESLPRSTSIVLYCGCCPFEKCPNIRPAFAALNSMGFQKLQVLILPTNFLKDWVEKGYPIQKGS